MLPVLLWLLLAAACANTGEVRTEGPSWTRTIVQEPDIFVSVNPWFYRGLSLAFFPFDAPTHLDGVTETVTRAYFQEILRGSIFASIEVMKEVSPPREEALLLTRWKDHEALLLGSVSHVLDGSRALATRLEIRVQLIDARTGETLWDLQQRASSQPGKDVDLYWRVIEGKHSLDYKTLASLLAKQLRELLAQEESTVSRKPSSPAHWE